MVKPHKKIRRTCKWCRKFHAFHTHAFHGYGSYKRTHKKRKR